MGTYDKKNHKIEQDYSYSYDKETPVEIQHKR